MNRSGITIGSRGSDLALYQANFIKDILEGEHGCAVEIKIIKTTGDKIDYLSFDKMEGKGFFTKELEESLLDGGIDLAVHSLKDLMTTQPDGLTLGAVGYRADSRELLLIALDSYSGEGVIPVKEGTVVGTSSARRQCQLLFHNRSLQIKDLRGNVPTRIRKLRDGEYGAILIAAAGVYRLELDLSDLKAVHLDPSDFLPAPAQGILGMQIRRDDSRVATIVEQMESEQDRKQAELERGLLACFDSGCTLPLGVMSEAKDDCYKLSAVLGVRQDRVWAGLKQVRAEGDNIPSVIEEAYQSLLESEPVCVWQ